MGGFDRDHYLNTSKVLLAHQRRRRRRRVYFSIDGIEPRAKRSMRDGDKDEVQRQLLEQLGNLHRRAFRGPLALRLTLRTTEKTPTQSHNVAKNLLDLFGRPRLTLATRRHSLLYADDHQVHALAVGCRHGEDAPMISAVASPLACLLEDLDLALQFEREGRDGNRDRKESDRFGEAVDHVKDWMRDEAEIRRHFGDRAFESLLHCFRQQAQENLLKSAAVTPFDLARMYDLAGHASDIDLAEIWKQMFTSTPLRIMLSELPQVKGSSTLWEQEIDEKLRAFQAQFGWLVDPLLVPVALEVLIKPPPASRQNNLHDLDNVLRDYLIPRVVSILKPVSRYAFMLDAESVERDTRDLFSDPRFAQYRARLPKPPASTKFGVTRYDAWRLPPAVEGREGFVSVAVVSDITGHGDIFGQIDEEVEKWRESLE